MSTLVVVGSKYSETLPASTTSLFTDNLSVSRSGLLYIRFNSTLHGMLQMDAGPATGSRTGYQSVGSDIKPVAMPMPVGAPVVISPTAGPILSNQHYTFTHAVFAGETVNFRFTPTQTGGTGTYSLVVGHLPDIA